MGIPCYHIVAIFIKIKDIDFKLLKFNSRWLNSYYNGEENPFDPVDLDPQSDPEPQVKLYSILIFTSISN